jgi:hypothetical protein
MHTIDKIQRMLEQTKQEYVRKMQLQGEFWCPLCDKWLLEAAMFQVVGHHAPDRLIIYGLCQHCTEKAHPDYVGTVVQAIRERGNKIEEVDKRLKFLLKDRIFKQK